MEVWPWNCRAWRQMGLWPSRHGTEPCNASTAGPAFLPMAKRGRWLAMDLVIHRFSSSVLGQGAGYHALSGWLSVWLILAVVVRHSLQVLLQ